jgi:ADP-ribosylglycohydrolase
MTLFTAEGLIRALVRGRSRGLCHQPGVVRRAYLRWLHTPGDAWAQIVAVADERPFDPDTSPLDGWLVHEGDLHARRAPGNTYLAALRAGGHGERERPVNDSKGCGGVMRAAPAGLIPALSLNEAFELGADCAAITHGHASGYLSAGALAAMVRRVLETEPGEALAEQRQVVLRESASAVLDLLRRHPDHEETTESLEAALALGGDGDPNPRNRHTKTRL